MYKTRYCPQCGAQMYADMDVCYECMFRFSEHEMRVPDEAYADMETMGESLGRNAGERTLRMCTDVVDASILVPQGGMVIGRGLTCDVILHSPAVSRQHVRVEPTKTGLLLRDLGSRNRTLVGDKGVEDSAHIVPGESFSVCDTTFTLCDTG